MASRSHFLALGPPAFLGSVAAWCLCLAGCCLCVAGRGQLLTDYGWTGVAVLDRWMATDWPWLVVVYVWILDIFFQYMLLS